MALHKMEFSDANFPHRLALCWSHREGLHKRWVPYGVPRLSPNVADTTLFLYERNPHYGDEGEPKFLGPVGTGVFVSVLDITPPPPAYLNHLYAVTAAHVARTGGSVIRINTKDGKSRFIEFDPSEWMADLDWEDLAAVDITDRVDLTADKLSYVPVDLFFTKRGMQQVGLGIGEDGFMLGLFAEQPGNDRNMVAARFGNLSLLADENEPISREEPDLGITFVGPCHAFDMHSRPGTSGSPVFIYRTPDGDLRDTEREIKRRFVVPKLDLDLVERLLGNSQPFHVNVGEVPLEANRFLRLLGIHVAQFHDEVRVKKINSETKNTELHDGDQMRFPGSMAIVIPAWQIWKLITEDKELAAQREERKQRKVAKRAGAIISESKTTKNPSHLEDFTRLLGAAAKVKPQDGQT